MPLDDASVESGCLHFLPGSHRGPVLSHHHIGHDPRVHGLEADPPDTTGTVAVPIPAGAATFHHPRMIHFAGPNRLTGLAGRMRTSSSSRRSRLRSSRSGRGSPKAARPGKRGRSRDEPREPGLHRPVARRPRRHVREPDRRARRGRLRARRSQGRAQPVASGRRARRARRHRRARHDPPHLDDVPAGAARGHARAVHRGVLRRHDRAEHLGAVRRLLRAAARTAGRVPLGAHDRARRPRLQQLRARCRSREHVRVEATNGAARAIDPLLPGRLHARRRLDEARDTCTCRSGARTRRCEARLRDRRRPRGTGPVPRLQRRRRVSSTRATGTARAR